MYIGARRWPSFLPKGKLELLDLATGTADQLIFLFFQTFKTNISHAVGLDLAEEMIQIGIDKLKKTKPYRNKVILQKGQCFGHPLFF